MAQRPWSASDDDFLLQNLGEMSIRSIGVMLERSASAVNRRAVLLATVGRPGMRRGPGSMTPAARRQEPDPEHDPLRILAAWPPRSPGS